MFSGCVNLLNLNIENFDVSNAVKMNSMFRSCYSLTSLDLSFSKTSKVDNMESIFS